MVHAWVLHVRVHHAVATTTTHHVVVHVVVVRWSSGAAVVIHAAHAATTHGRAADRRSVIEGIGGDNGVAVARADGQEVGG